MQISTKNKLKNFFRAFISLSFWMNGFCLGFVIWQTIKCMTKYIEKPKGTEISMKPSTNLSFPAISVCGKFEKQKHGYDWGFNHTYLQNVCGIRVWDYWFSGQWANSNCSDPKELFEAIVFKPEDVIGSIILEYWTVGQHCINFTKAYDSSYGRCFTLALSNEHTQYGIKKIFLQLLVNSTVYIHSPGMSLKGSNQLRSKIHVKLGKNYFYDVHHEYHEVLDYGGTPCNNDKTYQMDACNYNGTEKQSLEELGCTTPFGPNKNKICTNQTIGRKAILTYYSSMYSDSEKNCEGCHYPCSYFIVSTKLDNKNKVSPGRSYVCLNFEQLIQVTKSHYTYSELSLIAEIGGYVGLFLGISVNQMPYLLNVLEASLAKIRSFI